ncbi:conserved hypothetical protein [Exiguobacterium sp. 8A]|uniref:HNH endonuclease n=1 Tax=Exiguobacterium sp. 8A TaxID=2653139 RepID=UPI0012F1E758|nr:HNH endonuclease signature motif containing protein [Exiguobacterium sp. 8A]VXB97866.1 conserved hypothetical protein [Exiguobacterium sp. 8A]
MNKKRRAIFEKSGGRCWYCGCRLEEKGWHADHFEPIRRNWTDGTCIHPEYAVAKRYGLIEEQTTDVVFWFEKQEP